MRIDFFTPFVGRDIGSVLGIESGSGLQRFARRIEDEVATVLVNEVLTLRRDAPALRSNGHRRRQCSQHMGLE